MLYASAGLLTLLVALMVVRALVAAVSWVASGKTVWILPNVLQEVRQDIAHRGEGESMPAERKTAMLPLLASGVLGSTGWGSVAGG